jgi:starvation-inducible DNA-binding protein
MEQLIEQLKVILGTNFGLYLKAHNYHWNVEGNDFPQFHGFLDTFYTEVFAQNDPIAEHIRYLNAYAPGSFSRFLELSVVEESTTVPDALTMMTTLKMDNDRYIMQLRAGIVLADEAGEPAVGNFLQDLLGAHQKKAWMLRSITK